MMPAFTGGVWFADFEFHAAGLVEGNSLQTVCLVASELTSGTTIRLWQDELHAMPHPPFPVDESALCVAYMASAEMACFQALGWPPPANVLDLYAEFRNLTNGMRLPAGNGLIGALAYFGEPSIEAMKKEAMRDLVLAGGPWSEEEQRQILDYCESDVRALKRLFLRMEGNKHG